jgi:hypothetical protein
MRPVGWLVAVAILAAPPIAAAREGEYDPCKNRGVRRLAIVYAPSAGLLGRQGECKGNVYPAKKTVCAGDTVQWSVINTCDVEQISDIRLEGLDRVVERCSVVRQLGLGGAREIRCKLRRGMRDDVRQEYEVRGRVGRSPLVIDPELEIRRPR